MKTLVKLLVCAALVIPLSISAQRKSGNYNIAFKADVTSSCGAYLDVNFEDLCAFPEGEFITRWTWSFGDGGASNDWRPRHYYDRPGQYDVKLVIHTNLGRVDSVTKQNYIHVKGNVYVNLGNDTAIEKGSSIILDAGNPGADYWWNTGANTRKITVTEPGEYWVHVKKANCEARDRITITYVEHDVQSDFKADTTYTCGSFLKVNFKENSILEKGDFISRWTWIFGDGTTSNDWRPAHEYQKPGTYTVTLITQTDKGYTDTVVKENYITVEGDVYVNLGPDMAVCENTNIVLDAGNPDAQFEWSTGERTQKITITTPGEYWVHIKKGKCESRDVIRISEKPPVFAQFGFNMMGNCVPKNVQFVDSTTWCGSNAIVRRQWDFGDGNSSTAQHPSHTYMTADTFIAKLTVWDENGFSITRSKRVIIEQSIGAGPIVNLGNDTTVCEMDFFVLDAGNTGSSYSWSNGDFYQSTVITNTGLVWVQVQTEEGCVASDSVMVTVRPSLVPKFGYNVVSNCPAVVSFQDSTETCGVVIIQWSWDFGDGTTSDEINPTHTYAQSGTYTVQLTLYDHLGNEITKSKTITIQSGNLTVNLGKDTSVCMGEVLLLNAGVPNATYTWSTGETSQEISVMDDGAYSVTVTANGCTGTDTINVKTVFPVAAAFDYNITNNCLPAKVAFSDKTTSACGQQVTQWRWDFGDGTSSTEANPVHTYTTADSFAVRLTIVTNEGLTISKSKKIFIANNAQCSLFTSIATDPKQSATALWFDDVKVKASPNPSFGLVNVYLSKMPAKALKVTVIDRYGQPLIITSMSNMSTMLNLSKFAKGYYTIELTDGKGRKSIPVLIQ